MSLLDPDAEIFKSFTVGCTVVLQNLTAAAKKYNGHRAVVKSPLSSSGRQKVRIIEDKEIISVRPINLRYEPRELSSLSVEEMRCVLRSQTPHVRESGPFGGIPSELRIPEHSRILAGTLYQRDGDDSLAKIELASEEGLMSMMTDLLQEYSVDLATFLAIVRRKEQVEAIREGTKFLLGPPSQSQPLTKPVMIRGMICFGSIIITDKTVVKDFRVPHHGRCTEEEIEYIMKQQEYFVENPAELFCLSPKNMSMMSILRLFEKSSKKDKLPLGNCLNCGKQESVNTEFAVCDACGVPRYCSKDCQKADWCNHKRVCKKANNLEQKKERRIERRFDRFMCLYMPLLQSLIADRFAMLVKEDNVDAETIHDTHIVTVKLGDKKDSYSTRPHLYIASIYGDAQIDLSDEQKYMISHAKKMHNGKCRFQYAITHDGYRDKCVFYNYPVDEEFGYLTQHCTKQELHTSMDCKVHTINAVAMGAKRYLTVRVPPNLRNAMKNAVETHGS